MEELVFAMVINELKEAWNNTVSDPDLIELLYDAVAAPIGLTNKKGDAFTVSKTTASKIVNRQPGGNPLKAIRQKSDNKKVLDSIDGYFETNVVKRLLDSKKDDLIQHLSDMIKKDKGIADAKKSSLLALAQKNTLAKFLASVYLYSLVPKNVRKENEQTEMTAAELDAYKKKPLPAIAIPEALKEEEKKYASALLAIYAQLENISDISDVDLAVYPKHKVHFDEQRGYYFAAEAVRRGTRDIYTKTDDDQFEVLKNEVYEGVKEIWEDDYKNGMARLRKVLAQAAVVQVGQCWLSKDTYWIGNPQKKGVCHFLVKEDKLKGWVRDDDGK